MEIEHPFVFQADSDAVNDIYIKEPNYVIEYNKAVNSNYCVIYFASNNLYYPNNELAFKEQLVTKNKFEWYRTRINAGRKHIFIRDIKKQWYLSGINAKIDNPAKLLEFLKSETQGYKIITVGSSAGGFAAILYGQLLKADRIYTFNGQYEVLSLLQKSSALIDPIIFRNRNNKALLPYFSTLNFIDNPSTIYYFHSSRFQWDIEQAALVKDLAIKKITFYTKTHGVPFLKSNLPLVLNMPVIELDKFVNRAFHPLSFSLQIAGIIKTIEGLRSIADYYIHKLYINTILKMKSGLK